MKAPVGGGGGGGGGGWGLTVLKTTCMHADYTLRSQLASQLINRIFSQDSWLGKGHTAFILGIPDIHAHH